MRKNTSRFVAMIASTAMIATPVLAKTASGLQDLVGMRGASGESELENRGFTHIQTHKDEYRAHSYWWNTSEKDCVHVVTYDGNYESITAAGRSDCNQKKDNTGAAVAAVAGVGILAAVLASKKHHRGDKEYHGADLAQFDRGYRDGLHHKAYHNYSRSDAYSEGFTAGVRERNANTDHHYGHGGYHQIAHYKDLKGDRASSADSQMRSRGFRNVDSFKSGYTAYTIWNKRDSDQCVQMTVADGRVQDIRDIRTHPRCR